METSLLRVVMERYADREGVTLAEVASRLGMTPTSFSNKTSGSRPLTLEEAHAFASLLGTSMDNLWWLLSL